MKKTVIKILTRLHEWAREKSDYYSGYSYLSNDKLKFRKRYEGMDLIVPLDRAGFVYKIKNHDQ